MDVTIDDTCCGMYSGSTSFPRIAIAIIVISRVIAISEAYKATTKTGPLFFLFTSIILVKTDNTATPIPITPVIMSAIFHAGQFSYIYLAASKFPYPNPVKHEIAFNALSTAVAKSKKFTRNLYHFIGYLVIGSRFAGGM